MTKQWCLISTRWLSCACRFDSTIGLFNGSLIARLLFELRYERFAYVTSYVTLNQHSTTLLIHTVRIALISSLLKFPQRFTIHHRAISNKLINLTIARVAIDFLPKFKFLVNVTIDLLCHLSELLQVVSVDIGFKTPEEPSGELEKA